jgi:mannose-6-phosphate isomerase-like protein (cupin superfamily)
MEKTKLLNPKIYPKGWGEEVWIINCSDYCMKFLHFKAGSKGSMHFHVSKHETWYIQKGKLRVKHRYSRNFRNYSHGR